MSVRAKVMRPARAIKELERLKAQADNEDVRRSGPEHDSWKAKTDAVMARALGGDSTTLARFRRLSYHIGVYSGAPGEAERDAMYFAAQVGRAVGLIDAAIYELSLQGGDEPVDEHAYDTDLWAHVKTLVEDEEWGMVASQTAIFVENQVRTWAGSPQDKNGNNLIGKALYVEVFGDASDYRLGRQASEREGWRALGIGFAQALSNVDRHRIQSRDDAKRYALGVLGLGSLLLTQLRFEHGDILKMGD
jgi:hypothetical protein